MKKSILLVIAASILISCSVNERNVGAPNLLNTVETKENNKETQIKGDTKEIIFHVGPIDLPPKSDTTMMIEKPLIMRFQVGEPLWVTGFIPSIVNDQGERLSGNLLYRAILMNKHENNLLCPESKKGNPILATSTPLTKIEFPQGYGYPLLPTDPIEAVVSLRNKDDKGYSNIFFEVKIVAKPMNEFVKMRDLKPIMVDLDPCDHKPIKVGVEEIVENKSTYNLPISGSIILASGILQDFGVTLALTKNDAPIPFWRVQANLNDKFEVVDLDDNPLIDPAGIPLKSTDKLTFSSAFNNPTERWSNTSSAGAIIYFHEE